jgi:ligand-binding sensor protein/AraC-like DNA-binding protein
MTELTNDPIVKDTTIERKGLLQYFDRGLMEQFQHALVKATGLAFITVDYRGIPVTECTNFCEHCQRIRNDEKGRESCHSSDAYGAIQAAVSQKPHIYFCSRGMIEMAVPIVVNGQYMGGFIGGQIRCDDAPASISRLDKLQPVEETAEEKRQRLELFKKVPLVPYKQIVNVANLVSLIINQLCVRALETAAVSQPVPEISIESSPVELSPEQQVSVEALAKMMKSGEYRCIHDNLQELARPFILSENRTPVLLAFGKTLFHALEIPEDHLTCSVEDIHTGFAWMYQLMELGCQFYCTKAYPLMKDVFSYLEDHIDEDISLKDVVNHCQISQGYLSRILKKYYGISVMEYIHLRKLDSAKLDLMFTNDSMAEIAQRHGYASSSYFSKIFKKYEGVTCREYRQSHRVGQL